MPADPSASSEEENLHRDPSALTTDALTREKAQILAIIAAEVGHVREVAQLQLARIEAILAEREKRVAEQKLDTQAAITAALQAAEKAALKSELSTEKSIGALAALQTQGFQQIDSALNDVKERITRIESAKLGGNAMLVGIISIVGVIILVVGFIAANGNP